MYYKNLPNEIIHNILSYIDTVKLRNGQYMNQIAKNDKRYNFLLKIPRNIISYKYLYPCCHIKVNKKLYYIYVDYFCNQYLRYTYMFDRGTRITHYTPK
jgi:hypothetical protein